MTPREGFKYGFLLRCAEEGLTAGEAESRAVRALEKRAWGLETLAKAPGAIANLGAIGLTGAGLTAAAGGALGGHLLARMREGDVDPKEIQRQELIDAYRMQAEMARRKAIISAAREARPRPRSHHGI